MLKLVIRVTLATLLIAACGSKSEPDPTPRLLRWQLPAGQSMAYRFTAEASAVVNGEAKEPLKVDGHIFIDVDREGRAEARIQTRVQVFGLDSVALQPGASNFFFPMPETALGAESVSQSFFIKGMGTTSTRRNPDIVVEETLEKTGDDGKFVDLEFRRRGKATGKTPIAMQLEENGQGRFDLERGRYLHLERTTTMKMGGGFSPSGAEISMTVRFSLDFDDARSKARTAELAQRNVAPASEQELTDYLRANPVDAEITRMIQALEGAEPSALLIFHLRANPVATWQALVAAPRPEARRLVTTTTWRVARERRISDSLVAWFKREYGERPRLREVISVIGDERLRKELEFLSSSSSATGANKALAAAVSKRARKSLAVLELRRRGAISLSLASEDDFMEVGLALKAPGLDRAALVPALISILDKTISSAARLATPDKNKEIIIDACVQWLEDLTSRAHGKNVVLWKAFEQANRNKPYCQWMIDAAKQDTPALVNNALLKLARCHESREAHDYLATRMNNDAGPTRHFATLSLAELGDPRAVPALIGMLAHDNARVRGLAFVALSNFHNTTLGYRPGGDDAASRGAALGRWRAWAKSRPSKPSQPSAPSK